MRPYPPCKGLIMTLEPVGYFAASLVLATFCMRSMWALRVVAIVSNIAFITYGYLGDLAPIVVLHCVLLPVNIYRLRELGSAWIKRAGESESFPGY